MGKAVKAVAKVAGLVSSVAGTIIGGPAGAALIVGGALLSSIATPKPKLKAKFDPGEFASGIHLTNSRQISSVLPVVYGECRVGGTWIWLKTSGSDNKYLYIVQTLSEGPIYTVEAIYLNGKELSATPQAGLVTWAGINGDETNSYPTWVTDQGFTDNLPWTATLCIKLEYKQDKWNSAPVISAKVKGRTLYDPRTESVSWSNNPALVLLDFLRNPRYGFGVPDEFIDFDSFAEAANYCEDNGFTFNGIISATRKYDALETIWNHFRAALVRTHGVYKVRVFDLNNEAPVMHLTNDDIVPNSFRLSISSLVDKFNSIQVNYTDPELNYQPNTVTIDDLEAISTEQKKTKIIDLPGANRDIATRIANYFLKRSKFNKSVSIRCHQRTVVIEIGDVVKLSYDDFGISDKLFRVTKISYHQDDTVSLVLLEEDYSIYDTTSVGTATYPLTELPDPLATPPEAANLTVSESVYQQKDGSWTSRLEISFNEPDHVYIDHYEVWIQEGTGPWVHVANLASQGAGVLQTYYFEDTKENTDYTVKIVSVSIYGIKSAGISSTTTITGKDSPPADVAFVAAGCMFSSNIRLEWSPASAIKDLDFYEIRLDTNFGNDDANLVLRTKETIVELNGNDYASSRSWTFYIKAKDTSGNWSTNYGSITVENAVPDTPTVTLEKYYSTIIAKWNPVSGGDIVKYEVDVNGTVYDAGLSNQWVIRGTEGTTYTVKVRAVDICGPGLWSTEASATAEDIAVTTPPEGFNLVQDWQFVNWPDSWYVWDGSANRVSLADGIAGKYAVENVSGQHVSIETITDDQHLIPIDRNRSYIGEVYFRKISGTSGDAEFILEYLDQNYNVVGSTSVLADPNVSGWQLRRFSETPAEIPSTAVWGRLKLKLNYDGASAGDSVWQAQAPKLREVIESVWIADAAITEAKIADAAITNAKIANLAVDSAKIADGAITNAKIANLSVSTAKIADGAITNAKIANASIDNVKIVDGTIGTVKVADLAIAKQATSTITSDYTRNITTNTWYDTVSISISVPEGVSPRLFIASFYYHAYYYDQCNGQQWWRFRLYDARTSNNYYSSIFAHNSDPGNNFFHYSFNIPYSGSSGYLYVYLQIYWYCSSGSYSTTLTIQQPINLHVVCMYR